MNETDAPFDSAKLLLRRADENFCDFEQRFKAFVEGGACGMVHEPDPETGGKIVKYKIQAPMPAIMRAVYSDGVNNMRHALDQAVNDSAVLLRGGSRDCYFPVARDAGEFATIFETRRYRKVPVEIRPFLTALKPYRGGDDVLWALSRLTGPNKHQVVLEIDAMAPGVGIRRMQVTGGGNVMVGPNWDRAKKEMVIARLGPGAEMQYEFNVTTVVLLGKADVVGGQPALVVAHQFFAIVERFIDGIEAETARIIAGRGHDGAPNL